MLPRKQLDKIDHCIMMATVTEQNRVAWKLGADFSIARITEMKTVANKTLELYNLKKNPQTSTKPIGYEFQESYKKMSDTGRHYQHWIKGNNLVPDHILRAFLIGPRDPGPHEAKPEPTVVPGNAVERPGLNTLAVANFQTEEGGKRMTVRDSVNERVVRRYAITPHNQPIPENLDDLPWVTLAPDRKMQHTFKLSPAHNGMTFNLQSAFSNDRGQGPWSELYQITIS